MADSWCTHGALMVHSWRSRGALLGTPGSALPIVHFPMRNQSGSLQILGGTLTDTVLTLKCPQCSRTWESLDVTTQMLDNCYPCSSCTSKDPMKMIKMWIPRVVNCVILKMKVLPLDIFKDLFYIQGRSILPFLQMEKIFASSACLEGKSGRFLRLCLQS